MENHPSKKTLFALPGSLKAWLGRGVGAAGRLPEQQVALRAPRAPLLNPFFSAMAGDGGGEGGLSLGVAILKPDPRCRRLFPFPRDRWPRGGLENTMELSVHPPSRGGAAVAARKTQAWGEFAPGGRRDSGQPRGGRGPGWEASRWPEEATDWTGHPGSQAARRSERAGSWQTARPVRRASEGASGRASTGRSHDHFSRWVGSQPAPKGRRRHAGF